MEMLHIYPRRPRKYKSFWESVHNVMSKIQVAYPVKIQLVRNTDSKCVSWTYRNAIKVKKFVIYIKIPEAKEPNEYNELLIDRFVHEIAHILHYQALHEIGNDVKVHDEGWGVYYSKAYCLAYETT